MAKQIKTMGDLMSYANETNYDKLKAYLRERFQEWCKDNGRSPWGQGLVDWMNSPVEAFDISYWVIGEVEVELI